MHRLYFSLFLTAASAVLGLSIGLIEALGQLASVPWLREHGPHALEPLWQGAEWLSDHLEVLGIGAVGAFLIATVAAVVIAPRVVVSSAACEEEAFLGMLRETLLERGFDSKLEVQSAGLTCVMTPRDGPGAARQGEADPFNHEHHRRLDPVQILVEAMEAGDRHARLGEWSAALGRYHEAIGSLTTSTAPTLVAQLRASASVAQRKLGSMRSALRHADLCFCTGEQASQRQ